MAKNKNNHDLDLDRYEDLNGLSLKKMNFGLWLSENRAKMTKSIIALLIVISAGFFIYSSYHYVRYFLDGRNSGGAETNVSVLSPRKVVSDLLIAAPQIFKSGENYDLVVNIKNPNDKFTGSFQYCFTINDDPASCGRGFIMPSEEKYLFALGQKVEVIAPEVRLSVTDVFWQRIDTHKIPSWSAFAASRLNFIIEDLKFIPGVSRSSGERSSLDSLEFSITNNSAYGYYEVPLKISFYNGSELVGVNSYVVTNFLAGQKRSVRLSWLSGLGSVTRTEIRPELNLLDDNIYLKYQGR